MPMSAAVPAEKANESDAYMDLVWCKRTMELSIGGIDHFDYIPFADTFVWLNIERGIPLFTAILGHARNRVAGWFGFHDGYSSNSHRVTRTTGYRIGLKGQGMVEYGKPGKWLMI